MAKRRALNLALQGGGAHGAFTWGVLDALLEDGQTEFDGISGASAGAMNAVVLAQGLMEGGRDGARAALERFWHDVAAAAPKGLTVEEGRAVDAAPVVKLMMQWAQYLTPAQMNPLGLDPLGDVVRKQIDFEKLRRASPVKLFVAATRVKTGKLHIFRNAHLSAEALLASACLPTIHAPVVIDGEAYWDGGYAGNPAVFPLFYECHSPDTLLVLLNPLERSKMPTTADAIADRVAEVGFSAAFLREMRMFALLQSQLPKRWLGFSLGIMERRLRKARFHLIDGGHALLGYDPDTKLTAGLQFFERLRELGHRHGKAWLSAHSAAVGKTSSVDICELFL
ncbi:MAG: patatin-like phospholipase family protein [Paucibacter sp.]|nr:patatin-like phospholipase family protein [Roseateles sp.]